MDTSTLHAVTEELAALLSEVTQGDLGQRTPYTPWDVGDLYLYLMDQNIRIAAAIASETVSRGQQAEPMDRATLDSALDFYGGGLEVGYRQTAQTMENAFASVTDSNRLCRVNGLQDDAEVAAIYETHVSNSVIHTWDIAQALGFSYQPAPDIARRALLTLLSRPVGAQGDRAGSLCDADIFGCVLKLSGRAPLNGTREIEVSGR